MTKPKVFSYRRFSSGRQASGHSLERQIASAQRWCEEHDLKLDQSLVLADLGVSAYKGHNITKGALAGFLEAAQSGKVPSGSILLVESLDRLTRTAIPDAIGLLTSIVRSGIRVVSLIDGLEWNNETINDTASFMMSVFLFARAHEESATKSKRVSAAFQKKREQGLPVVSIMHGPGWVRPKNDRSGWELIPDKADSVKKVFEMAANGAGGISIAKLANQESWAFPWRVRSKSTEQWEHTGVSRLMRDRSVLGEWQPMKMVAGKLIPNGDPVSNYFPGAITEDEWKSAQRALQGRSSPSRLRGVRADIFSGLLFCKCGKRMERKGKSSEGRGRVRYYCINRIAGVSLCPSLPEAALIGPLLANIAQAEQHAFSPKEQSALARNECFKAEEKIRDLDSRIAHIMKAIEEGGSNNLLLSRLMTLDQELQSANSELQIARTELERLPTENNSFGYEMAKQAELYIDAKGAENERLNLAVALASVVTKIIWNDGFFVTALRSGSTLMTNVPMAILQPKLGRPKIQR